MDLVPNRPDTLKLALSAPLTLTAERILGSTTHRLNHTAKGFDTDTTTTLEEATAFFTRTDAANGSGLHRSTIVAQLTEVAPHIQNGAPTSLKAKTGKLGVLWLVGGLT
ncbi:hypothetical protein ACWGMA_05945 [Streptomyces asiaticus]